MLPESVKVSMGYRTTLGYCRADPFPSFVSFA